MERGRPGRGRPRVRRDLRGRRRERPVRLGLPEGPGRPPAHHRRVAVPGRLLPAPGLRAAPPVLRGGPGDGPGPAHAGPALVPAVRREAGQHPGNRRAVQGRADVPARHHELAVQGTAGHGVHPEHPGHDHRLPHGRGRGPAVLRAQPGAVHRRADPVPGHPRHRDQGRVRLRDADRGPRLRAEPLRDHRRVQGGPGVRLVLPGHRLPDHDPDPQPADGDGQPAPRGRGAARLRGRDDGRPGHRDHRGRRTARGTRQREGHRGPLPRARRHGPRDRHRLRVRRAPGSAPTSACTRRSGWPPTSAGS